jgi:hypothetical protein
MLVVKREVGSFGASSVLLSTGTFMDPTPQRSRAVFSTEDFELMKEAVGDYIKKIADDPRSAKFSNLYHRLGRLG